MMSENLDRSWQGRRILVTGGTGFVGSWLTSRLVALGAEVTTLARGSSPRWALGGLRSAGRVNTVTGSVSDPGLVEQVLREHRIDTCFHLAAQADIDDANRDPITTLESNVRGTWITLEACRSARVDRVILTSSNRYGSRDHFAYTESSPVSMYPYEASKVCVEVLARSYQTTFGMGIGVSRCANTYGGGDLNFGRLIPGTIKCALRGERPVIRSDGTPIRDYMHVDDTVEALLSLAKGLDRPEVRGRAFNFGANEPLTVRSVVELILQLTGAEDQGTDIRWARPVPADSLPEDTSSIHARSVLGWSARVGIREGLARTISWYREYFSELEPQSH